MRNIKLTIEYDGTRYNGWQRLGKGEGSNTISQKLSEVIEKMTGETPELCCAARTETGVHAYEQVANFKTTCDLKPYQIKQYINRYLPMDIAVLEVEDKPERFHASLNAKSRTYLYRISIGDAPSVFRRKYTYYSFRYPDKKAMERAAKLLIGKHNFKNFSSAKKKKSLEKEISDITIQENSDEIQIRMTANDFLHNMPRLIASTLLQAGLEKIDMDDIEEMLNPSVSDPAELLVDSKGLILEKITYEN